MRQRFGAARNAKPVASAARGEVGIGTKRPTAKRAHIVRPDRLFFRSANHQCKIFGYPIPDPGRKFSVIGEKFRTKAMCFQAHLGQIRKGDTADCRHFRHNVFRGSFEEHFLLLGQLVAGLILLCAFGCGMQ
jgi:hypothetical protein